MEAVLFLIGFLSLSYCAVTAMKASAARRIAMQVMSAPQPEDANTQPSDTVMGSGSVIGTVGIPALKLSAPIIQGIDPDALVRGVGHVPGTAVAGGLGTMGLAGHRDTFFRALRRVAPGMSIRVSAASGSYSYIVDSTEIVTPDEVRVLDIGSRPELVLVTCYPFNFVGAAPKRFIVHAHLLSVLADDTSPSE